MHSIAAFIISFYPKVAVYHSLYCSTDEFEATVKVLKQIFGAKAKIEENDGRMVRLIVNCVKHVFHYCDQWSLVNKLSKHSN